LGKGEFGEVYKGVLSKPGTAPLEVALKTLKDTKNSEEFFSEAKVMVQLVGLLHGCCFASGLCPGDRIMRTLWRCSE
jgi:hypothetical protein